MPNLRDARGGAGGFTLIEMVVVVAVIGAMTAIVLPELMPIIMFSRLEGAARHLAAYGRGAMAYACMLREPITISFDLDNQEYWAVRYVEAEDESLFDDETESKDTGLFSQRKMFESTGRGDKETDRSASDLASNRQSKDGSGDEGDFRDTDLMRARFDRFVRTQIEARSKQVKHGGILDEIGPLFEKKFKLSDEEEGQWEELTDPVLERVEAPEDVVIETVRIGSVSHTKGLVDVKLTAVGLEEPVTIYVRSGGDYYTVTWNPITGGSEVESGMKDPLDSLML